MTERRRKVNWVPQAFWGIVCCMAAACGVPYGVAAQGGMNTPRTLLWGVVTPKHDTSYLFGSFHLFGNTFFDTYPVLKLLLDESSCIVLETTAADESAEYVTGKRDHRHKPQYWVKTLCRSDRRQLKRYMNGNELFRMRQLKYYRPEQILAAVNMDLYRQKCALFQEHDMMMQEQYLAFYAQVNHIPLKGLESGKDNAKMWRMELGGDTTIPAYTRRLMAIVRHPELVLDTITGCEEAENYRQLAINYSFDKPAPPTSKTYAAALDERNEQWMARLTKILNRKHVFVSVGYRHLMYSGGLVAQLVAAGYQVFPVAMAFKTHATGS